MDWNRTEGTEGVWMNARREGMRRGEGRTDGRRRTEKDRLNVYSCVTLLLNLFPFVRLFPNIVAPTGGGPSRGCRPTMLHRTRS